MLAHFFQESTAEAADERQIRAASSCNGAFVHPIRSRGSHSASARADCYRDDTVEPRFYGLPNLFNILRNTSFLAIMACGQMLVMIVGGMDLSVGATAALASVIAAKVDGDGHRNPWPQSRLRHGAWHCR